MEISTAIKRVSHYSNGKLTLMGHVSLAFQDFVQKYVPANHQALHYWLDVMDNLTQDRKQFRPYIHVWLWHNWSLGNWYPYALMQTQY